MSRFVRALALLVLMVATTVVGTGAASAGVRTSSDLPSKSDQIAALNAALATMTTKIGDNSPQFGAVDMRDVFSYHVDSLWQQGIDGAGTTVAVLEGWDDPNIQSVLDNLDSAIGLPNTTVETVYPTGPLPATCPSGMAALGSEGSCDAWEGEEVLDVEAVHLIAPYATIVVSATPSDSEVVGDPASESSMPEIAEAMEYISVNHIADVISVSDTTAEGSYSAGQNEITAQDVGAVTAAANGVPVVANSGNCGVRQQLASATTSCGSVTTGPAVGTWADSPWVTAVGGSVASHTDPCPPCTTANGEDSSHLDAISGAGLSEVYPRPAYQDGIATVTGSNMRALPDLTMDSTDGTDESAPLFAGVLALATQQNQADLGGINDLLYDSLATAPAQNGLVDVTSGNNSVSGTPGYAAASGYDVASGWGTVDAAKFVPALADAVAAGNPVTAAANAELTRLQGTLAISPTSVVGPAQSVDVTSSGFLPGHPVTVSIDGVPVSGALVADSSGDISYAFTPDGLSLPLGTHTVTVSSMLLDQSENFIVESVATSTPVITAPADGSVAPTQKPTFSGTGVAGDSITVEDGADDPLCVTAVNPIGSWSCTPTADLTAGLDAVFAVQTDPSLSSTLNSTPVRVTIPGVPDPPEAVKAVAGRRSVVLSWRAPASDGNSPVTGYQVLRSAHAAGPFGQAASPHATSYTDHGLKAGTTYYYEIEAVNAIGVSRPSGARSGKALAAPSKPRSLTVTAARRSLKLSWKPPSTNGGSPVTQYVVQYAPCVLGSARCQARTKSVHATHITVTGLSWLHRYQCRVRAVNRAGDGTFTTTVSAKPKQH